MTIMVRPQTTNSGTDTAEVAIHCSACQSAFPPEGKQTNKQPPLESSPIPKEVPVTFTAALIP